MVLHVTNSPFTEAQVKLLNELLPQLTEQQKIWLAGYISATQAVVTTVAVAPEVVQPQLSTPVVSKTATVLFGSQTGNAQKVAEKLAADLAQNGVEVTVSAVSILKTNNLKKVSNLFSSQYTW